MNAREVPWERGLAALRRYAAVKGTTCVPLGARADGVDVGSWADMQRARYWAGILHPERIAALESLPDWEWRGKHQRNWHSRFAALRRYARVHDAGEIPVDAAIDGVRIGAWAAVQRAAYAAGTLPARNAALLETVPGWMWEADHDERQDQNRHRATVNGRGRKHTLTAHDQ